MSERSAVGGWMVRGRDQGLLEEPMACAKCSEGDSDRGVGKCGVGYGGFWDALDGDGEDKRGAATGICNNRCR